VRDKLDAVEIPLKRTKKSQKARSRRLMGLLGIGEEPVLVKTGMRVYWSGKRGRSLHNLSMNRPRTEYVETPGSI
jgi:hypothetical protein